MLNRNPETYNEIKTVNNILQISNYYTVSQNFLDNAYDFLMQDPKNKINCLKTLIHFQDASGKNVKSYTIKL